MTSGDSKRKTAIIKGQPIPAKRVTRHTLWKAQEYADYKEWLGLRLRKEFGARRLTEDITIHRLAFYRKGNRRADIDNLLKCVMEALSIAAYYQNDRQVVRVLDLSMEHGCPDPRIEITL